MEPEIKKKPTITEMAIKNQKTILVIAVCLIITLFVGTSYSMLTNFDNYNPNTMQIEKNGGKISVNNTKDIVTLTSRIKYNDEDGIKETRAVVFTITNTGDKDINNLKIKLVKDKDKVSDLDENNIKYSLSTDLGVNYTNTRLLKDNDNIIETIDILKKDKSLTVYLKVWVSESETLDNANYYGNIEFDF